MKKGLAGLVLGLFGALSIGAEKSSVTVPQPDDPKNFKFRMFKAGELIGFEVKFDTLTYCGKAPVPELYEIWDSSTSTLYVMKSVVGNEDIDLARYVYGTLLNQLGAKVVFLDDEESSKQQKIFLGYVESCRIGRNDARPATSSSKP